MRSDTRADADPAKGAALARSLESWNAIPASRRASYAYKVTFASWTGLSATTTIEVRDGAVVRRAYERRNASRVVDLQWTESGSDIGSHPEGAPALTVEQVHERCAREVLTRDPAVHDIDLRVGADNILSGCTYRHRQCADDCAMGYWIQDLTFVSPS